MLTARPVVFRVNGFRVTRARVRLGERGSELVIADPLLGEFQIDESFTLELLELLSPPRFAFATGAIADKFDICVILVRWPVAVEVIEECRPVCAHNCYSSK
jgi:hypothetical protein